MSSSKVLRVSDSSCICCSSRETLDKLFKPSSTNSEELMILPDSLLVLAKRLLRRNILDIANTKQTELEFRKSLAVVIRTLRKYEINEFTTVTLCENSKKIKQSSKSQSLFDYQKCDCCSGIETKNQNKQRSQVRSTKKLETETN